MRPKVSTVEETLARVASTQHGVVARAQLLGASVSPAEVKHRLRTGALLRVHRGVYRVGHRAPSLEARYLAAVLACGNQALLSGRAAAYLHGLLKGPAPTPEVTAPTGRRVSGVKTRRSPALDAQDAPTRCRIPVTTVARTLVDLAATLTVDDLARGVPRGRGPASHHAP